MDMAFDSFMRQSVEDIDYFDRDFDLRKGDITIIPKTLKPRISYNMLYHKDHGEYCFTNGALGVKDFHIYFEKLVELSNTPMSDLMNGETNLDITIYSYPNATLRDLFKSKMGREYSRESLPSFGRIGLYNSKDGEGKAPRIFFAIGHLATFHILACDPHHTIYP